MKRLFLSILLCSIGWTLFAQDGFQYLEVDGIKVSIGDIVFQQGYADSSTIGSMSLDSTVDITGDPNDVFTDDMTIYLEFGEDSLDIDTITINLEGGVAIKGHTYMVNGASPYHVYTTAGGIKTIETPDSTWTEPADYDFLQKDYYYYPGEGSDVTETTFLTERTQYAIDKALDIGLLVDTWKVAYYWDGSEDSRHGFVDSWELERPGTFPSGTPVIGISYIPFYVTVNKTVTSETYAVAMDQTVLDDVPAAPDETRVMYMTLVFDGVDNSFYIGRTANWDNLQSEWYDYILRQFVRTGSVTGGEYSFGLQSFDEGRGGWIDAQTLSGFVRAANVGDVGQAQVTQVDGSSPKTLYFKRVR